MLRLPRLVVIALVAGLLGLAPVVAGHRPASATPASASQHQNQHQNQNKNSDLGQQHAEGHYWN
jgi:hypothetical protein